MFNKDLQSFIQAYIRRTTSPTKSVSVDKIASIYKISTGEAEKHLENIFIVPRTNISRFKNDAGEDEYYAYIKYTKRQYQEGKPKYEQHPLK